MSEDLKRASLIGNDLIWICLCVQFELDEPVVSKQRARISNQVYSYQKSRRKTPAAQCEIYPVSAKSFYFLPEF